MANRFAYSNAFQGLWRVGRDEGLATFGRGVTANIARSVLMNVGQIATYVPVMKATLYTCTNMRQVFDRKAQLGEPTRPER